MGYKIYVDHTGIIPCGFGELQEFMDRFIYSQLISLESILTY